MKTVADQFAENLEAVGVKRVTASFALGLTRLTMH